MRTLDNIKTTEAIFRNARERGFLDTDIAHLLAISDAAVNRWKKGYMPSLDHLIDLYQIFGLDSIDELLVFRESPLKYPYQTMPSRLRLHKKPGRKKKVKTSNADNKREENKYE